MSAIFGILGDADTSELQAMSQRLSHRGMQSLVWSPASGVHFGQRAAGLAQGQNESRINFAGFIDNRTDVASELGWPDDRASPATDAMLVLDVFHKWGAQGFAKLTGQFALAIWDSEGRKLLLARDAWASAPLFLTSAAGRFVFATEYKALLCIDAVRAEADRNAIQYIHCTKYAPSDATCLMDVAPVPAGGWLELSEGVTRRHRYMNLELNIASRSDAAHESALRDVLIQAVRRQVAPHPTIGVALSGGLDSALLVGAVRHVVPERTLHTFTAGFGSDDGEVAAAAEVARHYRTEHHEVFLDAADLPALIPKTLWHMEDPIGREEKLFYYITARAARDHVPIMLAGHNADGLFAGMPRHRVVKVAAMTPVFKGALGEFYRYTQNGTPAASLWGKLLVAAYFRGKDAAPPDIIGATKKPTGDPLRLSGKEPMSQLLRKVMLESPSANSAIERIHAACGLSFNSPFLDNDLVSCSFEIPDRLKIKGWRQKHVLRQAGTGLLPDAILNRPKGLLRLKHDRVFCDVLDGLADEFLTPAAVAERGLFDGSYVVKLRRRPAGAVYSTDQLYRLWSVLLTELWARLFVDHRGDPAGLPGDAGGVSS